MCCAQEIASSLSTSELDVKSLTIQLSQLGVDKSELQSQLLIKDQEIEALSNGQQSEVCVCVCVCVNVAARIHVVSLFASKAYDLVHRCHEQASCLFVDGETKSRDQRASSVRGQGQEGTVQCTRALCARTYTSFDE